MKKFLKESYKELIIFLILLIICTYPMPYFVSAPGGLLDTSDRIEIDDKIKLSGSINMAYVSEVKGTIPVYLYTLINKNWDIDKDTKTEDASSEEYLDKMLLEEANNNAIINAYKHANIKYEEKEKKEYVTYIDKKAKTDLELGDQIIYVNNKKINNKDDLTNSVNNLKVGDKVTFRVIHNKKEYNRKATLINIDNSPKVGIVFTENKEIKTKDNLKFKFKDSESGPSGGLMTSLALYSYLTKQDLTKGKTIVGTGTIDEYGNVGEISGVKYKLLGASKKGADIFFAPAGSNYKEAIKVKKENNLKVKVVEVKIFDDALNYLKKMK